MNSLPLNHSKKRSRVLLTVLGLLFILVSTPLAIYLVKQRQEIRKEAAGQTLTCIKWSGGNYSDFPGWFDAENKSNPTIHKIHYQGDVSQTIGWQHVYWCDYRKVNLACRDSDANAFIKPKSSKAIYNTGAEGGYTPGLNELIVWEHFGGKCQVIQVDVTPCGADQPFYIIYANSECPTPTPTPTPTIILTPTPTPKVTPTPTPTPTLTPPPEVSCWWIKAYNSNWEELDQTDLTLLQPSEEVYFVVAGSGPGTFNRARFRINGGAWRETATQRPGTQEFYISYTIPSGVITFTVEAEIHHQTQGWTK